MFVQDLDQNIYHTNFGNINRDGFEKINKQIIDKEFKIPLNDKLFANWYPKLTGKVFVK